MTLKRWAAGEKLYAADLNGNFFWNVVQKTADQSKTSNTTLAADTELQFPVLANTSYAFRIVALYNIPTNTSGAPGIKFDLDGPASPTAIAYMYKRFGAGGAGVSEAGAATLNSAVTQASTGTGGSALIVIEGVLQNGANAGTFSFRWAQNTSDANATKVLKGSYLTYMTL